MVGEKVRFRRDGREYTGIVRDSILKGSGGVSVSRYMIELDEGYLTMAYPEDVIQIIRGKRQIPGREEL